MTTIQKTHSDMTSCFSGKENPIKKLVIYFILSVLVLCNAEAQYTKLLDFSGINGIGPVADVIISGNESYGMTANGGANDMGCIFKINTDGSGYLKLLDFSGTNGREPMGSLTIFGNVLYGLTKIGGENDMGCIFKINTDGSGYTKLHDFLGNTDGFWPNGSLILSGNILYGITLGGGVN